MQSPSRIHLSDAITIGLCPSGSAWDSSRIRDSVCRLTAAASSSLLAVITNGITDGEPCTLMTGPWLHVVFLMPLSERNDEISPHRPDVLLLSIAEDKYTPNRSKIPKNEILCPAVVYLYQRFVFLQNDTGYLSVFLDIDMKYLTTYLLRLPALVFLLSIFMSCSEEYPDYVIGVSQCSDDEWRAAMNKEIQREALFYPGLKVEIRSAHDDSRLQIEDIRYFASKGVDLLIVAPNEAKAVAPAVDEVYDSGIPVVLVDRKTDSDKYTAYVGADNFKIGQSIGKYVGERLGGRGNVVELMGLYGSTPGRERHEGFMAGLEDYPGINVVCSADAGWSYDSASDAFRSILAVTPHIDAVVSHNDRMAAGAYDVAKSCGRAEDMKFIGVDALTAPGQGVDKVLDKTLDATFIYPTGGDKAIQTAMAILEGKPYERETLLSTALVNSSNARVMQMQTAHIDALDHKISLLNDKLDSSMVRFYSYRIYLIVCVVLLAIVAALTMFLLRERNRLKKQGEELLRQRDQSLALSRQLEEATKAKLAFFTNVSHDFRTPLTLIADPVDQLRAKESEFDEHDRYLLDMIHKNVTLLLRLVNQILDFRKYESGKLAMDVSRFDVAAAVRGWAEVFKPLSYRKHVRFSVDAAGSDALYISADAEKLERIVYNLLSNAFKFTPQNGSIALSMSVDRERDAQGNPDASGAGTIVLKVSDTGVGMSAEHIRHIFENFYQADVHHSGSGIGLVLVKAFVGMHGGTVSVESEEGKGTSFTVRIPMAQPQTDKPGAEDASVQDAGPGKETSHMDGKSPHAVLSKMDVLREGAVADADQETVHLSSEGETDDRRETILVIDDNKDVRDYIRSLLEGSYNVIEAADGHAGLEKAMKYIPDAIICDVMMPVMDGMECCRHLKEDILTSHIPVMMLTAYAVDEQKIKGYECGADSYISKPFSARLLMVRLENLMESRRRLKSCFSEKTDESAVPVSDLDRSFEEKLRSMIAENLHDAGFTVESLGKNIGFSRVQLYRKTKALTGYSPVELLRITRLKKAHSILASSERTVAEAAYMTGFNSPSYFAKCYKEYFGESPADFLKKKK